MKDRRYTINLEWCGYPEQRYVARFLGEWIGQSLIEEEAQTMAEQHHKDLMS